MSWNNKKNTPVANAIAWIESHYQIIVSQRKKEELLKVEEFEIKEAWNNGYSIGDIGFIETDADEYFTKTYINDTGSR